MMAGGCLGPAIDAVNVSGNVVIAAGLSLLLCAFLLTPCLDLLTRTGWLRPNFAGVPTPTSIGVVLPPALAPGLLLWQGTLSGADFGGTALLLATGAVLFGLLDDACSETGSRGWRGHLASLRNGRWSSGAFKVIGVSSFALFAMAQACGGLPMTMADIVTVLAAGGVIAGAANTLNQFDTRPGRALKVFLVIALLLGLGRLSLAGQWLLVVTAAVLPLLAVDLSGRAMLGDAGSNALGVCLGLALVFAYPIPAILFPIFLVLIGLQAFADRISLQTFIEQRAWLRKLDSFGR